VGYGYVTFSERPGPIKIAIFATAPQLSRAVRRLRVRING
jgi:hypothetical protein